MSLIRQKKIPSFYEMLSLFQTLSITRQPACGKDVRRQLMWYNLDIQVGHKSLVNEQLVKRNINLRPGGGLSHLRPGLGGGKITTRLNSKTKRDGTVRKEAFDCSA